MGRKLTINCDVGEGCHTDEEVMPFIDCASISCASHAGSPKITRQTIKLAKKHKVIIGAHPGYDDRDNFGRLSLNLSNQDLYKSIISQLQLFQKISKQEKTNISYVKPHGALNQDMLSNKSILDTICNSIIDSEIVCPIMIPVCKDISNIINVVSKYNLKIIWEVFADRAYENNGLLRSRKLEGALHNDKNKIIKQIQDIKNKRQIESYYGMKINVELAESICIHGDHKPSIEAIKAFKP